MELYDHIQMPSVEFLTVTLRAPWVISVGADGGGEMYLVEHGSAWFFDAESNNSPVHLSRDGVVAVSSGYPHIVASSAEIAARSTRKPLSIADLARQTDEGGPLGPDDCRLFIATMPRANITLRGLYPAWVCVPAEDLEIGPQVLSLIGMVKAELAKNGDIGSVGVIRRLMEILVVVLLRYAVKTTSYAGRSMRAAADKHISRALDFIHFEPLREWTVSDLAREVGLGRSAFCERFKALTAKSPIRYLTELRIRAAGQAILEGKLSLGEIARAAGYESEAAFNRAFLRMTGVTPGRYRQTAVDTLGRT